MQSETHSFQNPSNESADINGAAPAAQLYPPNAVFAADEQLDPNQHPSDPKQLELQEGEPLTDDDYALKHQHISIPKTTTQCFEKAARIDSKNKEFKSYLEHSK